MNTRLKFAKPIGMIAIVVVVVMGSTGCFPPPPGGSASISVSGPLPLLPPPPPFMLPPAPTVVRASTADVYYVSNVQHDVYYVGGYFYTQHSGHWYCTHRPGTSWVAVRSVAYLPEVLRAGPPPPAWRTPVPGPPRTITRFQPSLPRGIVDTAARPARLPAPSARRPSSPGRIDRREPAPVRPSAPGRSVGGPPGRAKRTSPDPSGSPRARPTPPGRSKAQPPGLSRPPKPDKAPKPKGATKPKPGRGRNR